jgi:hypothetical protein
MQDPSICFQTTLLVKRYKLWSLYASFVTVGSHLHHLNLTNTERRQREPRIRKPYLFLVWTHLSQHAHKTLRKLNFETIVSSQHFLSWQRVYHCLLLETSSRKFVWCVWCATRFCIRRAGSGHCLQVVRRSLLDGKTRLRWIGDATAL